MRPFLIGFATLISALAGVAIAQEVPTPRNRCHNNDSIVNQLKTQFSEFPVSRGVDSEGNLVTTFASESGTWTIVVLLPSGPACIVSSGEGFENIKPE